MDPIGNGCEFLFEQICPAQRWKSVQGCLKFGFLTTFPAWIDTPHTAIMVYQEYGSGANDAFLQRSGLKRDATFRALLQALLNAIPRNRIKGKFVRPEAEVFENIRLAFFADLSIPVEEEPELPAVQLSLLQQEGQEENLEDEEGEEIE